MSATLEMHDLDLSDALQQALLAENTDQATRSGCQEGNESQQRWKFAYGQRAVLHGARKREQNGGEDEDGEGTGDSSDAGESEIASNENEGEEHDGGGEGQTQVKINKLSRWRADGKIPGRVTVSKERECSGEEGERGQQIPDDGSYSDIQHLALENNDDDLGLVNGSPEKEDQAKLRDRETAENQECLLCGEWGHGIRNCPYSKPEADLNDSYMPEQDQIVDYGDLLEQREDTGRQNAEEQIVNAADGEARAQAEKKEPEKRSAMAAAVIQQSTRCWIARSRHYELLGGLREQRELSAEDLELAGEIRGMDLRSPVTAAIDEQEDADKRIVEEQEARAREEARMKEEQAVAAAKAAQEEEECQRLAKEEEEARKQEEQAAAAAAAKAAQEEAECQWMAKEEEEERAREEACKQEQQHAAAAAKAAQEGEERQRLAKEEEEARKQEEQAAAAAKAKAAQEEQQHAAAAAKAAQEEEERLAREEEQAHKKVSAEAEWQKMQQEAAEEEAAEKRRQEDAERMALTRSAVIMQSVFRGKVARGLARDLRDMRLLQLRRFEDEGKRNARNAVLALMRRAPLQVLEFKRDFDTVVQEAVEKYIAKSASIMATPDKAAQSAIVDSVTKLWVQASIQNEKAIAAALVNSARLEVQKGLVLGRLMTGALQRNSLVKGLDKVNAVAQDCLSAALRDHLPLMPETVEERLASLKISIEAKRKLQTYVEVECNKVLSEMAEVTCAVKMPKPELIAVLACADPGSAMRQWNPLSHLEGNLNARMLKSRERTSTKQSIRYHSRTCQQRWQALVCNLDKCRSAFTDSVLGVSGGRGWDCTGDTLNEGEYAIQLADALSDLSPPSSSADTKLTVMDESKLLKRRIANLFAPKVTMRAKDRTELASQDRRWPDWEPGKFKPKHRDAGYAQYACKPEPHFITEVDMGSPELAGCNLALKSYTLLPPIVVQNFDHALAKLHKEIHARREARDEKGQGPSNVPGAESWNHIRKITRFEPGAQPTKDLFPTPRRIQKWRDRIRNAEAQLQAAGKDAGAANYADGGRDSVLSFVSGAETRAQSRFALAISGRALADNSDDRRQVEDSVEACDVPTALGLLTSAVEEFERLCERGRSSGSSKCSGNSAVGGKPLGASRVLPDLD